MSEVRGRVRGPAIVAGVLLLLPALVLVLPVHAVGEPGERIPTYDVVLTIGADGLLHVRETITYDFDRSGEHGIARNVRFRRGDRLFDVRDVRSSSSTGAPSRARTTRFLNDVRITVGDRGREVRGRQAYVIEYAVAWAFTPRADHDELVWDAIDRSWNIPIGHAAVRVEAPVPLRYATCRAGVPGATTRCLRDRDGPYAVDFIQNALAPHEGMKVKVRLPKRAVAVPPPRYASPRWNGDWTGTALLVLALAAVILFARRPSPSPSRAPTATPTPSRRVGAVLIAAGFLLIVADVGDDVVAHGAWAFSLGNRCLAGLALVIVGAGIGYGSGTGWADRPRRVGGRTTVDRSRCEQIDAASRLPR
ncbi:hypothetical protein GCM10022254_27760 [Actinomadura meridiana]|uniref:DUF2207 domain-containing protein n=1 Tax=Actinomadura meridiana TaxID=559626 RepID=A0ABP8C029_9ACTN